MKKYSRETSFTSYQKMKISCIDKNFDFNRNKFFLGKLHGFGVYYIIDKNEDKNKYQLLFSKKIGFVIVDVDFNTNIHMIKDYLYSYYIYCEEKDVSSFYDIRVVPFFKNFSKLGRHLLRDSKLYSWRGYYL